MEVASDVIALEKDLQSVTGQLADAASDSERLQRQRRAAVLRGKLEEAREELVLLKKVTEKTIPADVSKQIAIARLALRCKTAQSEIDLIEQVVKRHPSPELALDLLDARFEHKLATAEHDLLKKSTGGPDSNEFRIALLKLQADALTAQMKALRARSADATSKRERARLEEKLTVLKGSFRRAKAERKALAKKAKEEPRGGIATPLPPESKERTPLQGQLDLHLPGLEEKERKEARRDEVIFLTMNEKGELIIPDREPVRDRAAIKQLLRGKADRLMQDAKKQSATVVIRADRNAKFGDVVDLMDLCKQAGFSKIQLRAAGRRPSPSSRR
jgi:biopolymer transport protein ExbD